jgi:hypothetical protein
MEIYNDRSATKACRSRLCDVGCRQYYDWRAYSALAACPLHPPIAKRVVMSVARVPRTDKAIVLHSPAAHFEEHVADPFASMHFE